MTCELKNPARTLPFGMIIGLLIVLYLLVNYVRVKVLGAGGLMNTKTPTSDVTQIAIGPIGARLIASAGALCTLGLLSNPVLTSPRVYHAMAQDSLFFKSVQWIHPKTRVPVVAIVLQGAVALGRTLSGRYDQLLKYVTTIDYVFLASRQWRTVLGCRLGRSCRHLH